MEEPHKGVPHIDLVLNWGAHQPFLTRCARCDLDENQSAAGDRQGKMSGFGKSQCKPLPSHRSDKLRTALAICVEVSNDPASFAPIRSLREADVQARLKTDGKRPGRGEGLGVRHCHSAS